MEDTQDLREALCNKAIDYMYNAKFNDFVNNPSVAQMYDFLSELYDNELDDLLVLYLEKFWKNVTLPESDIRRGMNSFINYIPPRDRNEIGNKILQLEAQVKQRRINELRAQKEYETERKQEKQRTQRTQRKQLKSTTKLMIDPLQLTASEEKFIDTIPSVHSPSDESQSISKKIKTNNLGGKGRKKSYRKSKNKKSYRRTRTRYTKK